MGCVALALLLHAAVAGVLLRAAPPVPPRGGAQAAVAVRWLRVSAPPAADGADRVTPPRAVPRSEPARSRPARAVRRTHAVAAVPIAVVAPAAAPEPIDGAVFALPRIGYGATVHAAGMRAFVPVAAAPVAMQAGGQEALRHQIAEHIQRQLATLPPPPADGRCTLSHAGEPHLLCDSGPLTAALGEQAGLLARLVAAHQRSMPGTEPAAIEAHAGQFRLSLR